MIIKTLFRTIKSSFGRFAAILCIVALGVGVYTGLRSSEPSLRLAGSKYIEEQEMYDARLLSTLGITEKDVEWFSKRPYTEAAAGGYTTFIYAGKEGTPGEEIYQIFSLNGKLDLPEITVGRMPGNGGECLGDVQAFSEADIGKTITVGGSNDDDTKDLFRIKSFKLTGLCRIPRYISFDRDSTDLGSGTSRGFILIPESAFDSEVYHELLLKLDIPGELYSEEYSSGYEKLEKTLKKDISVRATMRYWDLFNEANGELKDARKELDDGWKEYNDGKADAEKELKDNLEKLREANNKLAENDALVEKNSAELEKKYADFLAEYGSALESADGNIEKINSGISQINNGLEEIAANEKVLDSGISGVQNNINALAGQITGIEAQIKELEKSEEDVSAQLAQLNGTLKTLRQTKSGLEATLGELNANKGKLEEAKKEAQAQLTELETQKGQLQALKDAKAEFENGRKEIAGARQEILKGWNEINRNWTKYHEAEAEAKQELEDALKELEDGEEEYADGVKELEKLEKPEVYVLGRDKNLSLVSFENDTKIVSAVATVFPIFFALISGLVCVTTMTRMVNEERTVIGTLKALGYSRARISAKYLAYAGLSSLLGCFAGYAAGSFGIPYVIWSVYGIMYNYSSFSYYYSREMLTAAAVICGAGAMGVTLYACNREFAGMPAELIRPKTPAGGKRILLERFTFLWKRLSFLSKVTLRNSFRYKKRMLMMLLGIGGCTALLVTGFGIQDSISEVMNYQYEEITLYDLKAEYDGEKTEAKELAKAIEESGISGSGEVTPAYCREETADLRSADGKKSCSLVIADPGSLSGIVDFHTGQTELTYPGKGEILVSEKLAKKLNLKTGDTVTAEIDGNSSGTKLKVTGIFDNYVRHFAYASSESFEETTPNTMLLTFKPNVTETAAEQKSAVETAADFLLGRFRKSDNAVETAAKAEEKQILGLCAAKLRSVDGVTYVSVVQEERDSMEKSMDSMDSIVLLIIFCSGALAFIVLYNLTNINIMERIREIATVKVLGFYPKETAAYVLRENIILSALGGAVGLYMGKYLHMFVITRIDVDIMNFDLRITTYSYLLSFIITIVFAMIANLTMRAKLNKIPMAESLKSVE